MKKIIFCFCSLLAFTTLKSQSVAINTDASMPDSKAMLDIKSTTRGLLIPRMTTAQRNAIGTPPTGLLVFDTDLGNFYFSFGSAWNQIGTASNTWLLNNSSGIYYNGAGNVGIGTAAPAGKLNIDVGSQYYGEALRLTGINPFLSFHVGANQKGYILNKNTNDMEFGTAGVNPTGNVMLSIAGDPKLTVRNDGKLLVNGNLNVNVGEQFDGEALRLIGTNPFLAFHDGISQTGYLRGNNQYDMELGTGGSNPTGNLYLDLMGNPRLSILNDGRILANNRLDIDVGAQFYGEALRLTGTNPFLSFHLGADQKGYIWNKNTNDMEFGTAGINASGNLHLSIRGNPKLSVWNDGRISVNGGPATMTSSSLTVNGPSPIAINDGLVEWSMDLTSAFGDLNWRLNGSLMAWISATSGSWHSTSDARLKTNVTNYKNVLPGIGSLNVVTYEFKRNPSYRCFGLIAQNVKEYFPEIVSENKDKDGAILLGIDYSKTGVIALKAIQEQQVIIESQQKNINDQQKKIDELEKRLAALEKK